MARKPMQTKFFERVISMLPLLDDEGLEATLRLTKQLQSARRMSRSALLNAKSPDGNVLSHGASPRPSSQVPQRIEEETL